MNGEAVTKKLKMADDMVRNGTIFSAPTGLIQEALLGLCDQQAGEAHTAKEINKGLLFTAILMERRNQKTNRLIIVLTVVGVLVGAAQIVFG